jgi:hypothetical protein
MGNIAIGLVVGFVAAVVLFVLWSRMRKKAGKDGPGKIEIHSSIEDIRSVGELVVFKIVTKEIVTAADHWFGEWGSKYLSWLASEKKMAMIFEFEINFRYNLRSSDFVIEPKGQDQYRLKMPKCFYDTYIRDISFYDEQNAKLLPWLVPELLSNVFGSGSNESDKNRLKEEAKRQAGEMAKRFVEKMQSEVQASARQTLEALGKAFGAQRVTVDFSDSQLVQKSVDSAA